MVSRIGVRPSFFTYNTSRWRVDMERVASRESRAHVRSPSVNDSGARRKMVPKY